MSVELVFRPRVRTACLDQPAPSARLTKRSFGAVEWSTMSRSTPARVGTPRTANARPKLEKDRLILRRGGKAVGVVISLEELKYFEQLEDRLDVKAAEKALAEPERTPYGEVRRKLGLK
jgi:hypothetical protein